MNELNDTKRRLRNTRIALVVLTILFFADLIGSYGIYEENIELKQSIQASKECEQKWNDFNKSFVPETALPRLEKA